MDPASGIGLVLGLAPMFSVCLEYFQYFKSAQSLSVDLELLVLKLDIEHERMIAWGEANGILESAKDRRNPGLDLPPKKELIQRALGSIESLFRDSKKLQDFYGSQPVDGSDVDATNDKFLSTSGLKMFRKAYSKINKAPGGETKPSVLSKTKWAIYDKAKFAILLSDIKALVDGLYEILPVSKKVRDKIIFKAIRSLVPDFRRLRLVETATEDDYSTLSEAANLMAEASEAGTTRGQSVGQWVEELDNSQETDSKETPEIPTHPSINSLPAAMIFNLPLRYQKLFFVLTPTCLSDLLKEPCEDATLGSQSISLSGGTHFLEYKAYTSFGNRITEAINPKFSEESLKILQQDQNDLTDIQALALEASLPIARVDVFCAPCACAIQTALRLCQDISNQLIRYVVKVDDRIPASCCFKSNKISRLNSLLNKIQESDAWAPKGQPRLHSPWIQFLDRVWIEQRIYELECSIYAGEDSKSDEQNIGEFMKTFGLNHSVLLGESDSCSFILQTKPFPWMARVPKSRELYQLTMDFGIWSRKFLGTFTPRNYQSPAPNMPRSLASTLLPQPVLLPSPSPSPSLSHDSKRQRIWEPTDESPIQFASAPPSTLDIDI